MICLLVFQCAFSGVRFGNLSLFEQDFTQIHFCIELVTMGSMNRIPHLHLSL